MGRSFPLFFGHLINLEIGGQFCYHKRFNLQKLCTDEDGQFAVRENQTLKDKIEDISYRM